MTEREKADAGLLYNAGDPALAADRDWVKDLFGSMRWTPGSRRSGSG